MFDIVRFICNLSIVLLEVPQKCTWSAEIWCFSKHRRSSAVEWDKAIQMVLSLLW